MVRASSLFILLPEPTSWQPASRDELPDAPSLSSTASLKRGPVRALVVLHVKEFSFFHFGATHVVDVDPHGALAQHCGAAAVEKLRRGLRDPPKYPTLGDACGHVLTLIFGQPSFYMRTFEALVVPVSGCTPPWDSSLLGKHTNAQLWHGTHEEVAFSPDLACCAIETRRDTQTAGIRVPIMMLMPLVPCDMDSAIAMRTISEMVREGKHKARRSKRDSIEDGEIEEADSGASQASSQSAPGVSKKRKHRSPPNKGSDKKMTAPGRLVFLSSYYHGSAHAAPGTLAHVHEVVDEDYRAETRVLRLRAIPSGDERAEVPDSQVIALDSKPSFERAWQATLLSGDEARKLSLFHGCVRHADRCKGQPLFGVFRTLVPGTGASTASH